MTKAIVPGSFDPLTNGHADVIARASQMFTKVYVGVAHNSAKNYWFTLEERIALAKESLKQFPNVEVVAVEGLLAAWCAAHEVKVIVKGLRSGQDFEYEYPQAVLNADLAAVETVFLPSNPQLGHISSSIVKELVSYGGNVENLVSKTVFAALKRRLETN
ncbi:pantetheine-phosphate adenylyltransferase [Gleimia sp. 6138-11-ORH1]|uniref:pantetheine-phosphate adenylyltransferase n=1 Tax=Gleimia sp. 6138-11-ORH1 TaxID=2973937 RepID=UPI00216A9262|nr:pantetheine-phosphate adenylyltransferase [Gleimia sp. 6138-11-ORH1]MCS4484513.1 pantetheine-phosphate adenylyltransferase [Gleimia sp. 6138-11-ORH1]